MLILLIAASIILLLLLVLLFFMKKKNKYEYTIFTKRKKKDVHKTLVAQIYTNLQNMPILKAYVRRVKGMYEINFPGDNRTVIDLTTKTVLGIMSVILLGVVVVFLMRASFFTMCIVAISIYVVIEQILQMILARYERMLIAQLDAFLDYFQFNFLQTQMVDEALHDSINGKLKLVEKHAVRILKILQSDDLDGDLAVYNSSIVNKYLKEFCMICVTTFLYGDAEIDGKSALLENIKRLKERLGEDIHMKKELAYNFKFLTIMCIIPLYTIEPLTNWGVENVPELGAYYNGYYGIVMMIVIAVISLITYLWVNQLKSDGLPDLNEHKFLQRIVNIKAVKSYLIRYYNNNYGKKQQLERMLRQLGSKYTVYTLAVKRWLFAIVAFVISIAIMLFSFSYMKGHIKGEITGSSIQSTAADESDTVKMMLLIKGYTDFFIENDVVDLYNAQTGNNFSHINGDVKEWLTVKIKELLNEGTPFEITQEAAMDVIYQYNTMYAEKTKLYTAYLGSNNGPIREANEGMYNMGVKQLATFIEEASGPEPLSLDLFYDYVTDDIVDRVYDYENAYFKWWQLIICFIIAFIAFWGPYIWLIVNKANSQKLLEAETMQYMSIILVLMSVKSMSASLLMDWILNFSVIFRKGVNRCIATLPADEGKAFDELIASEAYEPFQDLMRKMKMCDNVGVHKAFASLEVTRNNYAIASEQRAKQRISSNSNLAKVIAMLPLYIVLGGFLIAPFMMEAFGELTTTLYQMGQM